MGSGRNIRHQESSHGQARVLRDLNDPGVDLGEVLLQSWQIALRAEREGPRTIHIYLTQARGPKTVRALDRYVRMRRHHPHAASHRMWIGERGHWTYDGMADALRTRARGIGMKPSSLYKPWYTARDAMGQPTLR